MRNATINHRTACSHAQTPAARRACRKAARTATPAPVAPKLFPVVMMGKGKATHLGVFDHNNRLFAVECGSGLYRGVRRPPMLDLKGNFTAEHISCTKCAKAVAKLV